jgi:hypothetical protein
MTILGKITLTTVAFLGAAFAPAGSANSFNTQAQSVPTLDEWGLIGLIAAIGVVGGLAIRKRKKR